MYQNAFDALGSSLIPQTLVEGRRRERRGAREGDEKRGREVEARNPLRNMMLMYARERTAIRYYLSTVTVSLQTMQRLMT